MSGPGSSLYARTCSRASRGRLIVGAALAAATIAPATGAAPSVAAPADASVVALAPARLLDTRPGGRTADEAESGAGLLGAGETYALPVLGRGGVPAGAAGVLLNVTAVTPLAAGYLTVFPCGTDVPNASNVNFGPGDVAPNAVLAKVGQGGAVCIYTLAATHVVVDVNGYVPAGGSPRGLTPARLADTRPGEPTVDSEHAGEGRLAADTYLEIQVSGRGGVPAGAQAAMLNVTAVNPDDFGYLTVFPCGQLPNASTVNYGPGDVAPNAALATLDQFGRVCVYSLAETHVIVDVNGYIPPGGSPTGLVPARLLDTRPGERTVDGEHAGHDVLPAGAVYELPVLGRGGVPANATAVTLNVTAVGPDAPGYLTVYPCGAEPPTASNVNYGPGDVAPNAVLAKVGADGQVCVYSLAATHVLVDVTGYVAAPEPPVPAGSDYTAVAAGPAHTCAIVAGFVQCWGDNAFGKLGIGRYIVDETGTEAATPQRVVGLTGVTALAAGRDFACAVDGSGAVWCWGDNLDSQLGDPSASSSSVPLRVPGIAGAVDVAAGARHACAVLAGGSVMCWGAGGRGQLGNGSDDSFGTPEPVAVAGISNAVEVVSGADHTCARLATGEVRCWGDGGDGQLGNGGDDDQLSPVAVTGITTAAALAAGTGHTCAVLADATVECWGSGGHGRLGAAAGSRELTPVAVPGVGSATAVAAGSRHTCALLETGTVACWGNNRSGQLGGAADDAESPQPVTVAGITDALAIGVGDTHSCAVLGDGTMRCWGSFEYGQLGDGRYVWRAAPAPVSGLADAVEIETRFTDTCARRSGGTVECWGDVGDGLPGYPIASWSPQAVTNLDDAVDLGGHCAVRAGGAVACFSPTDLAAVDRSGVSDATRVTGTSSDGCAVLASGSVRCWEGGFFGAGNVDVQGLTDAVDVAQSPDGYCAIRAAGSVACWEADYSSPLAATTVAGVVGVTALSAAAAASAFDEPDMCAVTGSGELWCWAPGGAPAQISAISGATELGGTSSPFRGHLCVVIGDGAVECWGEVSRGQLGRPPQYDPADTDPSLGVADRARPVSSGAVAVNAGERYSCAQMDSGTVQCWGSRRDGRLGDGSAHITFTPVTVAGP